MTASTLPHTQTLTISGMSCQHCKKAVESAIKEALPLSQATIDLIKGTATISSTAPFDAQIVIDAIDDLGYQARKNQND